MASRCSAQTAALALLSAWSLASLVAIVVWSTAPELKGAERCRADLRRAAARLEEERRGAEAERRRLEARLAEERRGAEAGRRRAAAAEAALEEARGRLEGCRSAGVMLQANISDLLDQRELQRQQLANLSAHVAAQEEFLAFLQHNRSQALMAAAACERLNAAAEHQAAAARTQTDACRAHQDFLQRQLDGCKTPESHTPQTQREPSPSPAPSRATPRLPGLPGPALFLLVCGGLGLMS